MIAKAGLGLIGLGALGVGGVAMTKPEWFGISNAMPPYKNLASNTGLTGKWVNDYKSFFVSEDSQDWFKWAFKNRYEKEDTSNNKTKFSGLTQENRDSNPLTNACKAAYAAAKDNVKGTANEATGEDKFFEDNLWKYCSPLGSKPVTVDKTSGNNKEKGERTIGNDKKTDLISVVNPSNKKFWDIRNDEFYGEGLFGDVSNKLTVDSSHQFFKAEKDKKTHIKDICKLAYETSSTNSTSSNEAPTKDETVKYCSLKTS